MMSREKFRLCLTRKNFEDEFRLLEEESHICPRLSKALSALIHRMLSRNGLWEVDLPIVDDDMRNSVLLHTDGGKFLINDKVFQLYEQKSEGRPSYLAMSHLKDSSYAVKTFEDVSMS